MNNEINILITAGGTREPIDNVRDITNKSSGKLGKIICEKFLEIADFDIKTIFYIHGKNAVLPRKQSCIRFIPVESTTDLKNAIDDITAENHIDIIIHAMAVSDYTTHCVTTLDMLTQSLLSIVTGTVENLGQSTNLCDYIKDYASIKDTKISSMLENPCIVLKKTPKIISTLRKKAPNACIVGFKLLDNVPTETLIEAGHHLLETNDLDFVLANDLSSIKNGMHTGYLINKDKTYTKNFDKYEIAENIVITCMTKAQKNFVDLRCKCGLTGCVLEPAYIKKHYPKWYEDLGCPTTCKSCDHGENYDDEDK